MGGCHLLPWNLTTVIKIKYNKYIQCQYWHCIFVSIPMKIKDILEAPIAPSSLTALDKLKDKTQSAQAQKAIVRPTDNRDAEKAIAIPKDIENSKEIEIQFIGRQANGYDFDAELKAAKMYNQRDNNGKRVYTDDEIWQKTGTFKGPDGQWRQEIPDGPDNGVKYKPPGRKGTKTTLGDIIDHPKLFAAYPNLKKMPIEFYGDDHEFGYAAGYFNPATGGLAFHTDYAKSDIDEYHSTIHHEIQHAIQAIEDWQNGGNTRNQRTHDIVNNPELPFKDWSKKTWDSQYIDDLKYYARYLVYKSYGGEAASREVERRIDLSDTLRKHFKPQIGFDTPYLTFTGTFADELSGSIGGGVDTHTKYDGTARTVDSPEFSPDHIDYEDKGDLMDPEYNDIDFKSVNRTSSPRPQLRPDNFPSQKQINKRQQSNKQQVDNLKKLAGVKDPKDPKDV